MEKSLSLYIHIPYCLQKCHYCDFVKFDVNEIPPIDDYIKLLLMELELNTDFHSQKIESLYFGGGTPSLLTTKQFELIMKKVRERFKVSSNCETTVEINPGTLDLTKVNHLLSLGFNRFSLGVQTFNAKHLNSCGRKHSVAEAHKDLSLFSSKGINYSADILFGLPNQSLEELTFDITTLADYSPPHVSPYNLTLPAKHSFNSDRASDETQLEMMKIITDELKKVDVHRYEISNYSRSGFESQHNQMYWSDKTYLGLGMGAHSYIKDIGKWGKRLWNTGSYERYATCVTSKKRPHQKFELLQKHEALTDFFHTRLRPLRGFELKAALSKFRLSENETEMLKKQLLLLEQKKLISYAKGFWALTSTGLEMPNEVFKELCFLEEDLQNVRH